MATTDRNTDLDQIVAPLQATGLFPASPAGGDNPSAGSTCLTCGSSELVTEPAVDEEGMPLGYLVVTCDACGRSVGSVAPPEPSPRAEPEPAEGSLLPGPSEEPRPLEGEGLRSHHHPV